jgi:hypothetical protein
VTLGRRWTRMRSTCVFQGCRPSSATCMRLRNDSIMAFIEAHAGRARGREQPRGKGSTSVGPRGEMGPLIAADDGRANRPARFDGHAQRIDDERWGRAMDRWTSRRPCARRRRVRRRSRPCPHQGTPNRLLGLTISAWLRYPLHVQRSELMMEGARTSADASDLPQATGPRCERLRRP